MIPKKDIAKREPMTTPLDLTEYELIQEHVETSANDFKALDVQPRSAKVTNISNINQTIQTNQLTFEDGSMVYTTEIINNLLKKLESGDRDVDMTPFYQGKKELRDANVPFKMTPEEEEEWTNCFLDPVYFVSNYCKFKTDNGQELVKLYDFQEEIIRDVTDTEYDEETDLFIPKNKNSIIMASRQVGKCVDGDTKVRVKDEYGCEYDTKMKNIYNDSISIKRWLSEKTVKMEVFFLECCERVLDWILRQTSPSHKNETNE